MQRGTVNIFGRVATLSGRVAQTFEDTVQVDVPAELLPKTAQTVEVSRASYEKDKSSFLDLLDSERSLRDVR